MRFFSRKNNSIKIVYSHDYFYSIDSGLLFDVMKFKKIRDRLIEMKILHRKNVLIPEMVSYSDMQLVHSQAYLKSIRDPMQAAAILHIENVNPFDSHILEYFRIVTGGTLLATKYAIENQSVVFNLGGGYHHAHRDTGGGFCLVNDIAVAIEKYSKQLRCLIIDLDYHQGDGNLTIYQDTPSVYIFSMHASHWIDSPKVEKKDIILPDNCDGQEYLQILSSAIPDLVRSLDPEIIFYIAGSDPYINDSLGDLSLSREDMLKRNMYVYSIIKERKIPAVIVAGGGYGDKSWEVYYDFIYQSLRDRK
jgi:acetoin utilization deacetylase AcuC-like enzyme